MSYWQGKRAVVIGGSSGLGRALAGELMECGARVALVARGQEALDRTIAELDAPGNDVFAISADITNPADVARLAAAVCERFGGVDFVAHTAGRSMRGDVLTTSPDQFRELWELNFLSSVRTAQAFADDLRRSRGHLVLVSSLAGRCAPRFLGAYPASKFPLAAFAQQLRMELGPAGVHTLLVSPGPVAREGASDRYADQTTKLPPSALRPGAGARLRAIPPEALAKKILAACERRSAELVVPARARLLFAVAQLCPRLGDWLLKKSMSDR